jgi:hypothetical protein
MIPSTGYLDTLSIFEENQYNLRRAIQSPVNEDGGDGIRTHDHLRVRQVS